MFAFILSLCFMFTGLASFINLSGTNEVLGLIVGVLCLGLSGIFAWLSTHYRR